MENKISVITVTYNSEKTLKRTAESVLNQTYRPFEYIVVDGASTDGTVSVIENMRPEFENAGIKLTVISEKDNGIYDAMNKGINLASGDIVGIINSDDFYEANALSVVSNAYDSKPFDLFYADLRMVYPDGRSFVKHAKNRQYATSRDWNHPTTFITKATYEKYRYKTETIHDDYDLILRLKKANARVTVVNEVIADFTMDGVSHKRSVGEAVKRIGIKYKIYRQNGYSPLYFFECFIVEAGKFIIG